MTAGRVLIGRILKAHGIKGEVTFSAAGDDPGGLRPGLVVYLSEKAGVEADESLTLRAVRDGYHSWLLSFDEVTDRDAAELLAGRSLFIEEASLPPLLEGEYYQFQLVGLAVTRSDGTDMGRVSRVIDMPGHDLLEVRGASGEFLVPMRREFVEWIDLERGEIRLADRADLLEAQSKVPTPPFKGAADAGLGSRRPQPNQSSESAS